MRSLTLGETRHYPLEAVTCSNYLYAEILQSRQSSPYSTASTPTSQAFHKTERPKPRVALGAAWHAWHAWHRRIGFRENVLGSRPERPLIHHQLIASSLPSYQRTRTVFDCRLVSMLYPRLVMGDQDGEPVVVYDCLWLWWCQCRAA